MTIYNTLTGKKEKLEDLIQGKEIKLFVCGPTVYDYAHIGNARTYINFDIIVRYLRSKKYKVSYLQNITDVDNKIIKKAQEERADWKAIAKKYGKAYHEDEKALEIKSVNKYASATKYIKQILRQVQKLIEKGYTYKIEGDGYYFDISKDPDYGKLAKRTASQAEDSVSRIDESVNKRNKGDFALWKFSKEGEPSWKTKLGDGRPGWHIEDTAITEYYFGPQYDIHGGAVDLKFPHHEAEIAQQESISGKKPLAQIWMHTGFLLVNGEKMSKSLGNFVTIRDFLKKYPAEVLRYIAASHHYRSPIDYKEEVAKQAESALRNLGQFLEKLKMTNGENIADQKIENAEANFAKAMDDDFNTPHALGAIFTLVNEIQPEIWNVSRRTAKLIRKWVADKLNLLGISMKSPKIPFKIRSLARKRELSRSSKQFNQSDALRKQIEALGYTIEDLPAGPFLWPKSQI